LFSELNFHHLSKNLRKYLTKKVVVFRDKKKKQFLMNFWLIYLIKGELIPADGKVINCLNFFVDEQILTGGIKASSKKCGR